MAIVRQAKRNNPKPKQLGKARKGARQLIERVHVCVEYESAQISPRYTLHPTSIEE